MAERTSTAPALSESDLQPTNPSASPSTQPLTYLSAHSNAPPKTTESPSSLPNNSTDPSALQTTTLPPIAETQKVINVGTRRSALALAQTHLFIEALRKRFPDHEYRIHAMATMGDKNQVTALPDFGAKSLWTQELEVGLLKGELDAVVHSLKDMPTQLPEGCALGAVLPREDPRDAVCLAPSVEEGFRKSGVLKEGVEAMLRGLGEGSIIGTSSVRRAAQLKRLYPHLRFESVRGNVGTRLGKLDDEETEPRYSALILAAAGLLRLDLGRRINGFLMSGAGQSEDARDETSVGRVIGESGGGGILHAVGQGAIGVEIRDGDEIMQELLDVVTDERTMRACLAERSLLRTLEGGCSVPIGVETRWKSGRGMGYKILNSAQEIEDVKHEDEDHLDGDDLTLQAVVVSVDGKEAVETEMTRCVRSREEADTLGWDVAAELVRKGADKILENIKLNRKIIEQQGDA